MMRWLAALLLGLGLSFGAVSAAGPDWTRTATRTAAGGVLVGNPKARVRLVEIANYTCPHCAHFSREASAALVQRVRGGALSVEYRPIVSEAIGLAATMLARCATGPAFLNVNDALYARQDDWFATASAYAQINAGRLASYSELDQIKLIATRGGIADVAVAAGLPAGQVAGCFADRARLDDVTGAVLQASRVANATPTFLVGGAKIEGATWPQLLAKLRAQGLQ